MVSSDTALKILVEDKFTPLNKGGQLLTLTNFNELEQLPLSPGSEVDLTGYITYASNIRGADADIHFDLSAQPDTGQNFVVCEIQNADNQTHGKPVKDAMRNKTKVQITGVLRIFLEHVYADPHQPHLPHIFELHPVRRVVIDGSELSNLLPMDCPDHENFRNNNSVHQVELQDDGSMIKDSKQMDDNIQVSYDGTNLSFFKPPFLNVNYVYTSAYFSKTQNGPFPDGKPYLFELKRSLSNNSIGIKSVVIPATPAYDTAKAFHDNPPDGILTAVALRSLVIPELMRSNYKIMFCPVYRLEQSVPG
jgi:hypothetical protein